VKASRGRLLPGNFNTPIWPRLVDAGLSRTVRDTAMYLTLVQDPATQLPKLDFIAGKSPKRLKIAVMYEGMQGQIPEPEIKNAIAETAHLCQELGHTVEEGKPPLDQAELAAAAGRVGAIEVAKAVDAIALAKGIGRLEEGFESRALGLREEAIRKGPFDQQIVAALPILEAGTAALNQFFQGWDVLLTPVLRAPVYKIGMRDQTKYPFEELQAIVRDYVAYTALHNICGTTAMSVPLHWDTNGLPIGSQFAAGMGAEATLLALAYELEGARPWANRRSPLFAT
jgi:amidase